MNNMLIEIENEKLNLSASVNSVTYKGDRVPESGKKWPYLGHDDKISKNESRQRRRSTSEVFY